MVCAGSAFEQREANPVHTKCEIDTYSACGVHTHIIGHKCDGESKTVASSDQGSNRFTRLSSWKLITRLDRLTSDDSMRKESRPVFFESDWAKNTWEHDWVELARTSVAHGAHIKTGWLQDLRGDETRPRYVAKETAHKTREDVTQSSPAISSCRAQLSVAACGYFGKCAVWIISHRFHAGGTK